MKRAPTFTFPGETPIAYRQHLRGSIPSGSQEGECPKCGGRAYGSMVRSWTSERGWVEQRGWQCVRVRLTGSDTMSCGLFSVETETPVEEESQMPKPAHSEALEAQGTEPETTPAPRRPRRRPVTGATLTQLAARFATWISQAELCLEGDLTYPHPDDVLCEIGHRIAVARTRAGWNQTRLAQTLGYTGANTISKLECGQMASVDIVMLARIAHELDVDVEYFVRPAVLAAQGTSK